MRRGLRISALLSVALLGGCAGPSVSSPAATGGQGGGGAPGGTGGRVTASGGTPAAGGATSTGGASATGGATPTSTGGATGTGGRPAGTDAGAPTDASSPDATTGDGPGLDGAAADRAIVDATPNDRTAVDAGSSVDGGMAPLTCNLPGAAGPQTPTVYVIGDSTASVYASDLYPRMGWAQPLQDYFAPACATIQDKALSGRSSKSFFDEGAWTPIRNALRAGDFVLVQFGHNDEKIDEPALGTDPFTTFEQYLSIYIDDTLARGATPILLTSINRNSWSNGLIQDTHGDYPVAMRQLAQARRISIVDTTLLTKTYFERIGQPATTTTLFLNLAVGQFPNYPAGNADNTHFQETGARIIARIVLADLYRQGLAPGTLAKVVPQPP